MQQSARVIIEKMLGDYESKVKISEGLIGRNPTKDDGRLEYWKGKAEACREVLSLLDNEASRLCRIINQEIGGA